MLYEVITNGQHKTIQNPGKIIEYVADVNRAHIRERRHDRLLQWYLLVGGHMNRGDVGQRRAVKRSGRQDHKEVGGKVPPFHLADTRNLGSDSGPLNIKLHLRADLNPQ